MKSKEKVIKSDEIEIERVMKLKSKALRMVFLTESFFFLIESKHGENGVRHARASSSSSYGNTLTNKERKHMENGGWRHAKLLFHLRVSHS